MAILAIHPGEHLAEELKELGMSAAELARLLDVLTNRVTQILNGQRGISGDTALRLTHFFGTTAQFWLNLQSAYDLSRVEAEVGPQIARDVTPRAAMTEAIPVPPRPADRMDAKTP